MKPKPMSFEDAKRLYVHRYTMEHVPAWARKQAPNGKYYAPQFSTDLEWLNSTLFPPYNPMGPRIKDCYTTGQTWPLGQWLDEPYQA